MKKKILCVALVATMALSLGACGSKKSKVAGNDVKITIDELSEKMQTAVADIKAVDVKMAVDVDASMEAAGQEMSAKVSGEGDIAGGVEAKGAKASGNIKYSVKGAGQDVSGSYEGKAYVEVNGEEITVYYTIDGKNWYSASTTLDSAKKALEEAASQYGVDSSTIEDAIENSDSSAIEDAKNDIPELQPSINGKTVEAAGKECYEIISTVNKDTMLKLPGAEEQAESLAMFKDISAKCGMYVDVKTNLPVKFTLSMDMDVDEAKAGAKLDLKACEFEIELNYDNVDVTVPSDVKDKAVSLND